MEQDLLQVDGEEQRHQTLLKTFESYLCTNTHLLSAMLEIHLNFALDKESLEEELAMEIVEVLRIMLFPRTVPIFESRFRV